MAPETVARVWMDFLADHGQLLVHNAQGGAVGLAVQEERISLHGKLDRTGQRFHHGVQGLRIHADREVFVAGDLHVMARAADSPLKQDRLS